MVSTTANYNSGVSLRDNIGIDPLKRSAQHHGIQVIEAAVDATKMEDK